MSAKSEQGLEAEVRRVVRVADMMCTAHAGLRDRYGRRALLLDLCIMLISAWLVALAFIDPQTNLSLTPLGFVPQIWGGLLACGVFALSIIQLRVDWKGLASAHSYSFANYSAIKREATALLASANDLDERACRSLLARYDNAGIVTISERDFLAQKKRHLTKIEISKHLDANPAASILLSRFRLFLRHNGKITEKRE